MKALTDRCADQEKKPSYGQLMESKFHVDMRKALSNWRAAGKPHKR